MILTILIVLCLIYLTALGRRASLRELFETGPKAVTGFFIGFIADFLDTLGIGSFLTTTTLFRAARYLDDDRQLPGTLNVMHTLPTLVEALFFISVVQVDALTLISMVTAATIGGKLGSEIVSHLDKKFILTTVSIAMFLTSLIMLGRITGLVDSLGSGNTAMGLTGWKLLIGIIGNFILGALMSAGVGLYSPCMVMVYLLGMNPLAAFPIMMTSCAALMPVSSMTFMKNDSYYKKGLSWMILGGVIGVIIAATLVQSLSLTVLSWVIVVVGFFTSFTLFRASQKVETV
ncbi:sulfite exporter TauE/SafE family protein [Streptococcus sp. NLN64]|uniref:sulfite exporter TauE/SafE family protein n=1 Tax=Streptococcus sp. NLN64 TaxID=2822799 RepID=UPI001B356928|nr:sulfite exporter TauE/SafE family protein [Streptococcus sp. NLN64]